MRGIIRQSLRILQLPSIQVNNGSDCGSCAFPLFAIAICSLRGLVDLDPPRVEPVEGERHSK